MLVRREVFAAIRVAYVFVFALGILTSCGGSGDEGEQGETEPAQAPTEETAPETAAGENNVVVRVSGTPGTVYSGTYGTSSEVHIVDDATVGDEPTDYEMGAVEADDGLLNASFSKSEAGRETLEAEILVDGEAVTRSDTSAEKGKVIVNWVPEGALPEETLPKEREK
jgi:hypothetical protein